MKAYMIISERSSVSDKEYKFERSRVEKYLKKWFKPAGFGWFQVDVQFIREESLKDDNTNVAAQCFARWEYKSATLKFYLGSLQGLKDDVVERTVVHELCHILTSPIQDFSTDETKQMTEYATSLVTDALLFTSEMKTMTHRLISS
jgi:hypothetical protein